MVSIIARSTSRPNQRASSPTRSYTQNNSSSWVRSFGFSVQTEEHRFTVSDKQLDQQALTSVFDSDQNIVAYQLNPDLQTISYTALPDADHKSLDQALLALGLVQTNEVAQTSSTYGISEEPLHAGIAALLAFPLVLQMFGMWFGSAWHLPVIVEWALATPIQFWLGLRFYRGSDRSARSLRG